MLGDVAENQIGRDRSNLIQARLPEFSLDVELLGESEPTMRLDADFRRTPRGLRGQHLRDVRLGAAIELSIE